ncbi:MAG TPA: hypothetical protein VIG55_02980 [Methylosinus sp.]|jgi:hypothetical protein
MSNDFVNDFNNSQSGDRRNDLLARLYREIGLSAVAAALDVMTYPAEQKKTEAAEQRVPAILEETLAA